DLWGRGWSGGVATGRLTGPHVPIVRFPIAPDNGRRVWSSDADARPTVPGDAAVERARVPDVITWMFRPGSNESRRQPGRRHRPWYRELPLRVAALLPLVALTLAIVPPLPVAASGPTSWT